MLTPRQAEVARLVAGRGLSYKAVAKELRISEVTVRQHVLDAANRIPVPGKPRHRITVWFLSLQEEES